MTLPGLVSCTPTTAAANAPRAAAQRQLCPSKLMADRSCAAEVVAAPVANGNGHVHADAHAAHNHDGADDEAERRPEIFQVNIKLPHEPFETQIMVH